LRRERYCGAQIFSAIGGEEYVKRYTPSWDTI
jgi:hypothetical protein